MFNQVQGSQIQADLKSIKIIDHDENEFSLLTTSDGDNAISSHYFISCDIYTSLFTHYCRMTLILNDLMDIVKNMKIRGGELVQLEYRGADDEDYISMDFYINDVINQIKLANEKSGHLVLDCVHVDYYNLYKPICRKLVGTSDSIFNTIIADNVQSELDVDFVAGEDELQLHTNNKFVTDIISQIEKNDNVFFYQDTDGYHSKTLDGMLSEDKVHSFYFLSNESTWHHVNTVKSFQIEHFNNEILLSQNAIYPKFINLDAIEYKTNDIEKKFSEVGDSNYFEHLENVPTVDCIYGNIEKKIEKKITLYNLNTNVMTIKVNAHAPRKIGEKYKVEYKGHDNITEDHPLFTGDWLITDIKTHISVGNFTQDIKISKIKYEDV